MNLIAIFGILILQFYLGFSTDLIAPETLYIGETVTVIWNYTLLNDTTVQISLKWSNYSWDLAQVNNTGVATFATNMYGGNVQPLFIENNTVAIWNVMGLSSNTTLISNSCSLEQPISFTQSADMLVVARGYTFTVGVEISSGIYDHVSKFEWTGAYLVSFNAQYSQWNIQNQVLSKPTPSPTKAPTTPSPTNSPTPPVPTSAPTTSPPTTPSPTNPPTTPPTNQPTTPSPTNPPSYAPTERPTTPSPTNPPSFAPTERPTTPSPTNPPTTPSPTNPPSYAPTGRPTIPSPTNPPSFAPTERPTTLSPTNPPTKPPTTMSPTNMPTTHSPSRSPTNMPTTRSPTRTPTEHPTTASPTNAPTTASPTRTPTSRSPTNPPSFAPTQRPTTPSPTNPPTRPPTNPPTTRSPTNPPSHSPTNRPTTRSPTNPPTKPPTPAPTTPSPTNPPSRSPTNRPSSSPTSSPGNRLKNRNLLSYGEDATTLTLTVDSNATTGGPWFLIVELNQYNEGIGKNDTFYVIYQYPEENQYPPSIYNQFLVYDANTVFIEFMNGGDVNTITQYQQIDVNVTTGLNVSVWIGLDNLFYDEFYTLGCNPRGSNAVSNFGWKTYGDLVNISRNITLVPNGVYSVGIYWAVDTDYTFPFASGVQYEFLSSNDNSAVVLIVMPANESNVSYPLISLTSSTSNKLESNGDSNSWKFNSSYDEGTVIYYYFEQYYTTNGSIVNSFTNETGNFTYNPTQSVTFKTNGLEQGDNVTTIMQTYTYACDGVTPIYTPITAIYPNSSSSNNKKNKLSAGAIVGIVCAGVLVCGLAVWWITMRRSRESSHYTQIEQ